MNLGTCSLFKIALMSSNNQGVKADLKRLALNVKRILPLRPNMQLLQETRRGIRRMVVLPSDKCNKLTDCLCSISIVLQPSDSPISREFRRMYRFSGVYMIWWSWQWVYGSWWILPWEGASVMSRTLPYSHQSNGVMERYNQTMRTMVRSMLIDQPGKCLWPEACSTYS